MKPVGRLRLPLLVVLALLGCRGKAAGPTGAPELDASASGGGSSDAVIAAKEMPPAGGTSPARVPDAMAGGTPQPSVTDAPIDARESAPAGGTPHVYVSGNASEIRIFLFDSQTGVLTPRGTAAGGDFPSYLAWDPTRRFLYALNRNAGPSKILAFAINPAQGALTRINEALTAPGSSPPHISVHPSGKWLFAAHISSGHVTVHPIRDNGSVGTPADAPQPGVNPHMAMSDPAGMFLFVPCLGSHFVAQYKFEATSGKLTPNNPPNIALPTGSGPRHMAFHPTARFAYVINETNSTIASFKYTAATGLLSEAEVLSTIPAPPVPGNTTAHVLVHPNGKFVYGSNRGHNSIVIFSVNESTGRLTLVGHETGQGAIKTPRNFTIDPTGKFLLVANQDSNTVLVFRIQADGSLMKIGNPVPTAAEPTFVGVLPLP